MEVLEQVYTLAAFIGALVALPGTLFFSCGVHWCRAAWLKILQRRYPHLEFVRHVSGRVATDTPRNRGDVTLLLTVRGKVDPDHLKQRFRALISKKRDDGSPVYPRLTMVLRKVCGRYAWDKHAYFHLENHLVFCSPIYRGRLVTELNIQDYMSEIASKYLPSELPPWQIAVVSGTGNFYVLLRIHHLLLAEEKLGLDDLLEILNGGTLHEDDETPNSAKPLDTNLDPSPLSCIFRYPTAIATLWSASRSAVYTWWGKLLSSYDPLENPSVLKAPDLQTCTAILAIASVTIIQEAFIVWTVPELSLLKKMTATWGIIGNELERRQCNIHLFFRGFFNTLQPLAVLAIAFSLLRWVIHFFTVSIPVTFAFFILGLRHKEFLVLEAIWELFYILKVIYRAPICMLRELMLTHRDVPKHRLQKLTLCGRKVLAWSDAIPVDPVRRFASTMGISPSEVLIAATAGALKESFRDVDAPIPKSVLTSCRFFPMENLLTAPESGTRGRGLVCLSLPLKEDPKETLQQTNFILTKAQQNQPALFEISHWQMDYGIFSHMLPSVVMKLLLNYLSRRFSVILTEVAFSDIQSDKMRKITWAHNIENIMYWRPPQSNISLSLTLMCYGNTVRLGAMADAQVAPQHSAVAMRFAQQLQLLLLSASRGIHHFQPPQPRSATSSQGSSSEDMRSRANRSMSTNSAEEEDCDLASTGSSINSENVFLLTD